MPSLAASHATLPAGSAERPPLPHCPRPFLPGDQARPCAAWGALARPRRACHCRAEPRGVDGRLLEQPARLWGRVPASPARAPPSQPLAPQRQGNSSSERGGSGGGGDGGDGEEESTWGVFSPGRFAGRWDVPWGPGRVAGVMALWFGSFVGVGFVLVPQLYRAAGVSLADLGPQDRATFTLVCQLVETGVSLALIRALTAGPLAAAGDPSGAARGLFVYDPRRPFSPPRGWAFWALLGVVASPLVVGGMAALLEAVGYESAVGGRGTVDGVSGMIRMDGPTYASLLAVTGGLAPLLEETVFRGFLLTSLTRFMPTWAAVVASAVAFGCAHLSARDLPVLCALGLLLGSAYVRSRNLLTPIIIHGAWNSAVLSLLFWLASQGFDVAELLEELRNGAG